MRQHNVTAQCLMEHSPRGDMVGGSVKYSAITQEHSKYEKFKRNRDHSKENSPRGDVVGGGIDS